jgi:membrane protease YdiL (CAAX protease family)
MSSERDPPRPDVDRVPPRPDQFPVEPFSDEVSRLSSRPSATWRAWEAIAVYVVAFLVGGLATLPVLGWIENDDLATLAASAVAALIIAGVIVGWLRAMHPRWRDILGFPRDGEWWTEVRSSVGFGIVLYPAMVFLVGLVLTLILGLISGESVEAPEQVPSRPSTVAAIVTVVYAIVIAPLHEELFFRGALFRAVRDRHGLVSGLLASGVGFGLIHFLDAEWQDALLLIGVMFFNGIALAWWYERRGTIVAPLLAHMTFNVIGLSLIFALR